MEAIINPYAESFSREKMIQEIEEKKVSERDIEINCGINRFDLRLYFEHEKSNALNGEEIQRIFNYLNELK